MEEKHESLHVLFLLIYLQVSPEHWPYTQTTVLAARRGTHLEKPCLLPCGNGGLQERAHALAGPGEPPVRLSVNTPTVVISE